MNIGPARMVLSDNILKQLNPEPVEVTHDFKVDISLFVTANFELTIGAINQDEARAGREAKNSVKGETDPDVISEILYRDDSYYDDRRVAARNMALVGLLIRLQHWAAAYARRIDHKRKSGNPLRAELDFLNANLGKALVGPEYFQRLTDARDSIVHANAQPHWAYRSPRSKKSSLRSVDSRYVPEGYRVAIGDADLAEAVHKSIALIKWYDEKLTAAGK